jgi:hypothetical protein
MEKSLEIFIDNDNFLNDENLYVIIEKNRFYTSQKKIIGLIRTFLLKYPKGNIVFKNSENRQKIQSIIENSL